MKILNRYLKVDQNDRGFYQIFLWWESRRLLKTPYLLSISFKIILNNYNLKYLFVSILFCKTILLFANQVEPINFVYLNQAEIKKKAFFSCYRNPFNRFGLSLSNVSWELGIYNENRLLKDFDIILENKKDSNFFKFSFQNKLNNTTLSYNFKITSTLNDSIYELTINGIIKENEKQWNCSKLQENYYLIIEKEAVFLFYNNYQMKENLILQFKIKG